ncbi:MAG: universal stress protein [Chthonomonadales bacterium]
MIVTTKDNVIRLTGSLVKNQWLTIKAAANLLLKTHPEGIIIDCSGLEHVTDEGARTFLDALRDIQSAGARIVVCNLPDDVQQVLRTVPGVRSQLPIARSLEEARASLQLSEPAAAEGNGRGERSAGIIIPILSGLDIEHALVLAARLARDLKAPVHLVYLLEVSRNLPLTSPLLEEEEAASRVLQEAVQRARKHGLTPFASIERVRDPDEGLLQILRNLKAVCVVVGGFAHRSEDARFFEIAELLLRRAPCSVLVGRKAPEVGEQPDTLPVGGIEDEF